MISNFWTGSSLTHRQFRAQRGVWTMRLPVLSIANGAFPVLHLNHPTAGSITICIFINR